MKGKVHYHQSFNLGGHINYSVAIIAEGLFIQGYLTHNFDQISFLSDFEFELVGEAQIKTPSYQFDTENPLHRRIMLDLSLDLKGHPSYLPALKQLREALHVHE